MNKYKICPACGAHHPPTTLECSECDIDLTSVQAVDDTSEILETRPTQQERMVRICVCGAHNPPAARKCQTCGEEISDIIPVPESSADTLHYILASVDGKYAYELIEKEVVIGRVRSMGEYLSKKPFVSREQAEFTINDGKLFVQNISHTNYTYVNNEHIGD